MDSDTVKFVLNFLAKKVAAWAAASLVTIGALQPGQESSFITMAAGIIVGLLAFVWSWWNDRGKQLVLATLAKAHRVAPMSASTAAASKAMSESVNDNKLLPMSGGAVKIVSALLIGFLVMQAVAVHAATATPAASTAIQSLNNKVVALVQKFETVTVADLTSAKAIFDAAKNTNGSNCAAAWLVVAQANASIDATSQTVGIFSVIAKAYNIQVALASGSSLSTACAPMMQDLKNNGASIAGQLGGGAAAFSQALPILAAFGL